uniref:Nucleoside-diphosphate kinase n=1 Tax=Aquila chrysaetos chrysaetos TaxID=223781 RepID=A0A663E2I7_AQUCH
LDCSAETMNSRLLMRNQSSQHSDNTEAIKEAIESYFQASKPVIAYYERKTQLCKVNCLTLLIKYFNLCTHIPT